MFVCHFSDSGQEEDEEGKEVERNSAQSKSGSGSEGISSDSLPRQSVMRRPFPSTKPPSDYNPSTSSESESSSQSQSESGTSSDEDEEEAKNSVYASDKLPLPRNRRHAQFGSDSDDNDGGVMVVQNQVKKKRVPFYSSEGGAGHLFQPKSFYINQEETQYGLPRRRAARNVKYVADNYSGEDSDVSEIMWKGGRKSGRRAESESDSEFQLSEVEAGDEVETFESESVSETTSSDEYTPYTRKRGGGGGGGRRKRKSKVRKGRVWTHVVYMYVHETSVKLQNVCQML